MRFLMLNGHAATLLIAFAAAVEGAAGVIVIVDPAFFVRLLWATSIPPGDLALARIAGIALLALALACWPRRAPGSRNDSAVTGLLAYNAPAAILFFYVAIRGEFVGWLLWPAVVFHAVVAVLLAGVLFGGKARLEAH